jgi:hypothetical protein
MERTSIFDKSLICVRLSNYEKEETSYLGHHEKTLVFK